MLRWASGNRIISQTTFLQLWHMSVQGVSHVITPTSLATALHLLVKAAYR